MNMKRFQRKHMKIEPAVGGMLFTIFNFFVRMKNKMSKTAALCMGYLFIMTCNLKTFVPVASIVHIRFTMVCSFPSHVPKPR